MFDRFLTKISKILKDLAGLRVWKNKNLFLLILFLIDLFWNKNLAKFRLLFDKTLCVIWYNNFQSKWKSNIFLSLVNHWNHMKTVQLEHVVIIILLLKLKKIKVKMKKNSYIHVLRTWFRILRKRLKYFLVVFLNYIWAKCKMK